MILNYNYYKYRFYQECEANLSQLETGEEWGQG